MTFTDNLACDYLLQYDAARILIEACHAKKASSLFAKDQVVTVLANMSSTDACAAEIKKYRGLELLVAFLHVRPPDVATDAELTACEHVQQKAAIALTRMCREASNAKMVANLNGECAVTSRREFL